MWSPKENSTVTYNNADLSQTHDYVGIAGGCPDPSGRTTSCLTIDRYGNSTWGSNGMLYPNGWVKIADVLDGTSNTVIVGEQSGVIFQNATNKTPYHISANYYGGWTGHTQACVPVNPVNSSCTTDLWGAGVTTIINTVRINRRSTRASATIPMMATRRSTCSSPGAPTSA